MSAKRRFNDDQVKSLETTFETESKPELPLKKHLANQLGLHPRQVAIWFQNKRARSKSKQIERDYVELKSNFDKLKSELEDLSKENRSLLIQVERLRNMEEKRHGDKNMKFPVESDVLKMDHIVEGHTLESTDSFELLTFFDKNNMTSGEQWWDF